jgi:hypothetical protein
MTCDATTVTYVAGDDFDWDYVLNEELSDDDLTDWSDLLVEFRDGPSATATLLATSEGDGTVDISDTNYSTGRVRWIVDAAVTGEWANLSVYMHVRAKVDGVETTIWPPQAFFVGPQVATRIVEAS